jgi:hypothetical protein
MTGVAIYKARPIGSGFFFGVSLIPKGKNLLAKILSLRSSKHDGLHWHLTFNPLMPRPSSLAGRSARAGCTPAAWGWRSPTHPPSGRSTRRSGCLPDSAMPRWLAKTSRDVLSHRRRPRSLNTFIYLQHPQELKNESHPKQAYSMIMSREIPNPHPLIGSRVGQPSPIRRERQGINTLRLDR